MAIEISVIFVLVLVNGVFSGAEIAVVAMRHARLQQLAAEGRRGAAAVLSLRAQPERFFATVQVGITLVGATAGAFGGATIAERIEPLFERIAFVGPHAEALSVAIVVVFISYLSIVIGELVPKSLALKHAEPYALIVGRALLGLSYVARPVVWLFTATSNVVLRPFGDHTTFAEARLSAEELKTLLEEAGESGTVDRHVGEIASRALELGALTAREVMVPRSRIDAIPVDATPDTLRRILLEQGHSRMPVYKGTIDNVVGYVVVKDIIGIVWEGLLVVLHDLVRPAYFIPESMPARRVLREFQRRRTQIAIVVDEHGGVSGLVTVEDILEEIVGDLSSEDDTPEALVDKREDGAIVQGHAPLRDVNRALGLDLPEGDAFSTVGGLCMHLAGGVPQKGVQLDAKGVARLEVLEASSRTVRLVRVTVPGTPEAERPAPSQNAPQGQG